LVVMLMAMLVVMFMALLMALEVGVVNYERYIKQ